MKIQKFKRNTHLKRNYLLMLLMVLLPVVLNFYSPTLMGWGLRNGIITASVIVFCVWFFLSLFLGRAISCGYTCPYRLIQEICGCWVLNKKARNKEISNLKYLIFAIFFISLSYSIFTLGRFKGVSLVSYQGLYSISVKEFHQFF